jgi:hypothetical protein
MVAGGILKKSIYTPTDKDCTKIWIHTNSDIGATNLKTKVCDPIDNFVLNNIANNQILINKKGNILPLQKLKYFLMVKNQTAGYENKENEKKRISIKINSKNSLTVDPVTKQPMLDIFTKVFIPENVLVPVNERKFKTTPEKIECLDDLRKHVSWNSTVRFVLRVQKFWAQKQLSESRSCGIVLICEQIYIIDNPSWGSALKFNINKIPHGMGIAIATPHDVSQGVQGAKEDDEVDEVLVKNPSKKNIM